MPHPQNEIAALEKSIAEESLGDFIEYGWGQVEARPFVRNWHMDAVADHLMAVSRGDIRKIIINIPPRHTKSLICNVFWPSWDWIHNPWRTYLFSSYRSSLSERDNKKANKLVASNWFQNRFDPRIDPQNNTNSRWGITSGGERLIASVAGASSTGEGGDGIMIDDPISADGARHPAQLKAVIEWWEETIKSRLNDPKTGFFVVIMQRLREDDLTGHILAHETGWDHLCLPARYEVEHKYPIRSSIGFKDPRTKEGELLNPKRFDDAALCDIARPGSFEEAGQLQQRPAPKAGGMFMREWFNERLNAAPMGCVWCRGWDLAASIKKSADRTSNVLIGKMPDGRYLVADAAAARKKPGSVEAWMKATAMNDGKAIRGSVPVDPGQAGLAQKAALSKLMAGFDYRFTPESGDKATRASPFAAQAEAGNVVLLDGPWIQEWLDELCQFPNAKHDDLVDATSRAFNELVNFAQFKWHIAG